MATQSMSHNLAKNAVMYSAYRFLRRLFVIAMVSVHLQ
jgi:hypothetical protein